jgi:hypothetical protein
MAQLVLRFDHDVSLSSLATRQTHAFDPWTELPPPGKQMRSTISTDAWWSSHPTPCLLSGMRETGSFAHRLQGRIYDDPDNK